MAEITAQKTAEELYNSLTPLEKQQYDGVMGMGGFKQRYMENPTSQFVLGDANYGKFKAVADAEAAVPKESFLDKINIFGSASAAEPSKTNIDNKYLESLYTPSMQETIFGDRNYFNNQTNNLPFSIADLAAKNAGVDVFPTPGELYSGAIANNPTYLAKQQMGFPTGITASSAAVPFGTADDIAQGFVKGSPSDISFSPTLGIDTSFGVANEPDDEEDVEGAKKETQSGIAKLLEFVQRFSPLAMIGRGVQTLVNPKASDFYRPATQGIMGYTPAQLNQMNALGGYYTEPARAQRRAEKRLANLIQRKNEGKSYSQKNLDMLTAALEGAPSQAQFATAKAAARSPKVGVRGFTARDSIRESRRGDYF